MIEQLIEIRNELVELQKRLEGGPTVSRNVANALVKLEQSYSAVSQEIRDLKTESV